MPSYTVAPLHPLIDTERVRQQHPIVDLIGRYGIQLRRSGGAFVGRCPFHADGGRPNLTAYPRSGRYVCFRCGANGDAIDFVRQLEHLSFREAVARLSVGSDVSQTPVSARQTAQRAPQRRPTDPFRSVVLDAALELYHNRLMHDSAALAYLAARGFDRELAERSRLGFSAGDELPRYLAWRGLPITSARRAGLLDARGRERLAGRIVFPEIRAGKPTWLIGRQLESSEADDRYYGLRGPKPLLGWEEAKQDLRGVCLVEGPFDLLAMRKWGLPALAVCGTRLHPARLDELGRWARLYAVFDADDAGRAATRLLVEHFGDRVRPISLPSGANDPADLARDVAGAHLMAAAIRKAMDSDRVRDPNLGGGSMLETNRNVVSVNARGTDRRPFSC